MKLKKMIIVLLGVALTFSSVAWCGPGGGPVHGRGGPHGLLGPRVLEALNLEETQRSEIDAIRDTYKPQLEELHIQMMTLRQEINAILFAETIDEDALLEAYNSATANMESIRVLEKEIIVEIRSILTAEQIAEIQELMQERME